jgi:O-antigen ligase
MSFLTVTRSVWFDSILILLLYWKALINNTNFKKMIFIISTIILFININYINEFINNYLLNPFEGSSFEMRFSQFFAALDLLKNNFIFGLGIGFVQNFIAINTLDTDILGFESILFTSIIETGFIGFLSLVIFLIFIRKSILHSNHNHNKSIDILFIPFIFTIILTGEMQNLSTFSFLMTILFSINLSLKKNTQLR